TPTTHSPWETSDSRAEASRAVASRDTEVPTRWAKTPSGMLRDDCVEATQCTWERSDPATARASVVLPTPGSPTSTTPQDSLPVRADRTAPNSAGRSTICQIGAMPWSVDRCARQFSAITRAFAVVAAYCFTAETPKGRPARAIRRRLPVPEDARFLVHP